MGSRQVAYLSTTLQKTIEATGTDQEVKERAKHELHAHLTEHGLPMGKKRLREPMQDLMLLQCKPDKVSFVARLVTSDIQQSKLYLQWTILRWQKEVSVDVQGWH